MASIASDLLLDARYARNITAFGLAMLRLKRHRGNVVDAFEAIAARQPNHPAIRFGTLCVSFAELDAAANAVAEWGLHHGLRPGLTVALAMANAPRFVEIWMGLCKLGVAVSLINTSLPASQMRHCLAVTTPVGIIADASLCATAAEAVFAAGACLVPPPWFAVCGPDVDSFSAACNTVLVSSSHAPCGCPTYTHPPPVGGVVCCDLPGAVATQSSRRRHAAGDEDTAATCRALRRLHLPFPLAATWGYIFTSGTTGLPKAAAITHARYLAGALLLSRVAGVRNDDTIFTCLPLFHSAGGIIGVGACLTRGCTLALVPRFRASTFWSEVVQSRATVVQYLGETCRFLLATPRHCDEARHSLRLAFGNGLRPDVWAPFQVRCLCTALGAVFHAYAFDRMLMFSGSVLCDR